MKWNSQLRQGPLLGAVMLAAISLGCGGRSDLAALKGRVKFKNGEAINLGTIEYERADSTAANLSGARIVEGAYEIPQEKGLRAGKYVVRIYAPASLLSPQGGLAPPGARPPGGGKQALQLPEERVSPAFNSQSKLTVQVTDEAMQTFDFEVE